MITQEHLANIYEKAHEQMRTIDGLNPQDAFNELLKYLYLKQVRQDLDGLPPSGLQEIFQALPEADLSGNLGTEKRFLLSDAALLSISKLFEQIKLNEIDFDLRALALRLFLNPELRRGLGIFLTPDNIAKTMVAICAPDQDALVLDPACGSGTFLIETLKFLGREGKCHHMWGMDINLQMLNLAKHNLPKDCHLLLGDFLKKEVNLLPPPDLILTNPPFGLYVEIRDAGQNRQVVQSEIIFLKKCLKLLKPGGKLAMVVPKSVISNLSLEAQRKELDQLGFVYACLNLPSQTFLQAGTQISTSVLFCQKHTKAASTTKPVQIAFAQVRHVGLDERGRAAAKDDLKDLQEELPKIIAKPCVQGLCRSLAPVAGNATISQLCRLIAGAEEDKNGLRLSDLAEVVVLGRTPRRSAYAETQDGGMFILKVGNLSGKGINWQPRHRNYVRQPEAKKRLDKNALLLKAGDIVLTASAHIPRYIAEKVDIVYALPAHLKNEATFVGEIMLIRPKNIDPYFLLAFLRLPATKERLRQMARGQTAHLMPFDVCALKIPDLLLSAEGEIAYLASLLKKEAEIFYKLNELAIKTDKLAASLSSTLSP